MIEPQNFSLLRAQPLPIDPKGKIFIEKHLQDMSHINRIYNISGEGWMQKSSSFH